MEAKEQSKRKAKELQAARVNANKGRGLLQSLSSSSASTAAIKTDSTPNIGDTAQPVSPPASKAPAKYESLIYSFVYLLIYCVYLSLLNITLFVCLKFK